MIITSPGHCKPKTQIILLFYNLVVSHQDSTFLFTEPDSLVGFWIALDDATVENGCLWMIPGSHKTDVHKRFIRNPDKCATSQLVFQGTQPEYEQSLYVPLPVEKCKFCLLHGTYILLSNADYKTNELILNKLI